MKSTRTPIPETRQKETNAGTPVSIPMKKAKDSQKAAVKTLGPTSLRARAILSSTFVI